MTLCCAHRGASGHAPENTMAALARAIEMGAYLMDGLAAINSPHVELIRGRGMWVGVVIKEESGKARPFCEKLMERGVLCKETHEQVIRFAPPLVVKKDDLDFLLEKAREVLT